MSKLTRNGRRMARELKEIGAPIPWGPRPRKAPPMAVRAERAKVFCDRAMPAGWAEGSNRESYR